MHGVTRTIEQIRERGVPGFDVEVIGTDPGVDRRLPAAAELELPFYPGMQTRRPGPAPTWSRRSPRATTTWSTSPPPARPGSRRRCSAGSPALPLLASYHTELATYAGLRAATAMLEMVARAGLGAFYDAPARVALAEPRRRRLAGRTRHRRAPRSAAGSAGWTSSASIPSKADRDAFPGEIKVLYAGRLSREKGVDLLADAFLRAHEARPPAAPAAGGRRPRGGGAARAPRRRRHLPRLARRGGARDRLRERRRLPLLQRHRYLRPGDPRGGRQRTAGGRDRRGRARGAGREPPHRAALPSRRRPRRRRAAAAGRLAGAAARSSARPERAAPEPAPGSAR